MKKTAMVLALSLLAIGGVLEQSAQASIVSASSCKLDSAPANAPDWQAQTFPLIVTTDGYEAATSTESSEIFELAPLDPSSTTGWPALGGKYYQGGSDVWVIVTPKDAALPQGATFKVIKPLETDPNTGSRPATYICHKSM